MITAIIKDFFSLFLTGRKKTTVSYTDIEIVVRKDTGIILGCFTIFQDGKNYIIKHAKSGLDLFSSKSKKDIDKQIAQWTEEAKKAGKSLDEVLEEKSIEKLLSSIPRIKNFSKWFDDISIEDFDVLWKNRKLKAKISALIRHPGGLHEWLMCSRANVFKKWGVSMKEIKFLRTKIEDVIFKNPSGYHGGPGSTKAHNEILDLIDSCNNYSDFKKKLITWSEDRLEGGKGSLPSGFFD